MYLFDKLSLHDRMKRNGLIECTKKKKKKKRTDRSVQVYKLCVTSVEPGADGPFFTEAPSRTFRTGDSDSEQAARVYRWLEAWLKARTLGKILPHGNSRQ